MMILSLLLIALTLVWLYSMLPDDERDPRTDWLKSYHRDCLNDLKKKNTRENRSRVARAGLELKLRGIDPYDERNDT